MAFSRGCRAPEVFKREEFVPQTDTKLIQSDVSSVKFKNRRPQRDFRADFTAEYLHDQRLSVVALLYFKVVLTFICTDNVSILFVWLFCCFSVL